MNLRRFAITVVFASGLVAALIGTSGCRGEKGRTGSSDPSPLRGRSRDPAVSELQAAFRAVHDLYEKRVVLITTETAAKRPPGWQFFQPFGEGTGRRTGLGSGFLLTSEGYICTNHHVVADADSINVHVGTADYKARVVGSDQLADLALLKIERKDRFDPAYLGDSDRVQVGDWAIAIGSPFGLERSFTVGVVSAVARPSMDEMGNRHIQTDASINPGNSGGPLINVDGEVIGVNRMIYSKSGGSVGIGFAIPINEARRILDQLKRSGKVARGYIGAQIADLNEEQADRLGLGERRGVYVAGVVPGGPAERGGLREGDVILTVNGKRTQWPREMLGEVARAPIGTHIRLSLWRAGRQVGAILRSVERP